MNNKLIFIGSVTVLKSGSMHRITIPKKAVIEFSLKPGDKLLVYINKDEQTIIIKKP